MRALRTPLNLPLALFLISGLIGVWASFDPQQSWEKFALLVAAYSIFYVVALAGAAPRLLHTIVWIFLFFGAGLALYFATQNDFEKTPTKIAAIRDIGLYLHSIAPQFQYHVPQSNIISGALEIALPLSLALLFQKPSRASATSLLTFLFSLVTSALIAFGLVMTVSRGAWLAIGLVGGILILRVIAKDALVRYILPLALVLLLLGLLVTREIGGSIGPVIEDLLGAVPAGDGVISRLSLAGHGWDLIQDYNFTGSGLGTFPMVLSSYALLIDVLFLPHIHNTFLQIWLEQGLLGIVSYAWLIAAFYSWAWRHRKEMGALALGGIAATTIMLVHGLADVLLYSSRALPLMFLPMAVTVADWRPAAVASQTTAPTQSKAGKKAPRRKRGFDPALLVAALVVLVFAVGSLALTWKGIAAMWYANLGSVAQTRYELRLYEWPDSLVEDIRRGCVTVGESCGLNQAAEYYRQALALDPANVTANQRLAEIGIAQGAYNDARTWLERALRREPSNLVTLQLIGDAYLGLGQLDQAYTYWSKVPGAETKLQGEAWARYEKNGDKVRSDWAKQLAKRVTGTR